MQDANERFRQFVETEQLREQLQNSVTKLTEICWRKCVKPSMEYGDAERDCMRACTRQYFAAMSALMDHSAKYSPA